MHDVKDSYEIFLSRFNSTKEDLYNFGIEETIFPAIEQIKKYWENLIDRLYGNQKVYIRGAGRDAKGTDIYLEFYKFLFQNENITKDPSNNQIPHKIIEELTGYKRNKTIINYQVSHVFGCTKNPLLFEAPWNIAFVPKLIDPLTGHETKGKWPKEYQKLFLSVANDKFKEYIMEYNVIVENLDLEFKLDRFINNLENNIYTLREINTFKKGIIRDFRLINY